MQMWRVPQAARHRLAAAAADAVVTLNSDDADLVARWQRIRRERIRVIPHGVDCEQFRFDPAARRQLRETWRLNGGEGAVPFVIGTAGRLSREKRVDLLIEATALLRRRGVPIIAVAAGQGVEREKLLHLARAHGVAETVRFIDFVQDMPAFYSALDVFVLCSQTESFGLALAEAMACERAVAATPTAGARQQIEHGVNGWQLNGFSADELADAITAMYADPEAAACLGARAREGVIRDFRVDLTLERTLQALRGPARTRSSLRWPGGGDVPCPSMMTEDAA
jgi:glycosyltransferase involved in cell wall biosynthesis